MSVTAYAFIEAIVPGLGAPWAVARLYLRPDIQMLSVLAHPWGDRRGDPEDKRPLVPCRGAPSDMAPDALSAYCYLVDDERAAVGVEGFISEAEAQGRECTPFGKLGHVLDPRKWRHATWLTTSEVAMACLEYHAEAGQRSPEIEGAIRVMRAWEEFGPKPTLARLVLWFR